MFLEPAIDILDASVVRLAKGDYNQATVYGNDPLATAAYFESQGASWVHFVDLNGARTGESNNIDVARGIVANTNLKLEYGGGVRSCETIEVLAEAGVSRIVLGTALVKDPEFTEEAIARFGDLLAAGIDARDGRVAVAGWLEGSDTKAVDLASRMSRLGFKHLVYTDIARDGMQCGIDTEAYERIADAFENPVTASGGIASIVDIEALGRVSYCIDGIIAGRAIYEGSLDIKEAVQACKALS